MFCDKYGVWIICNFFVGIFSLIYVSIVVVVFIIIYFVENVVYSGI